VITSKIADIFEANIPKTMSITIKEKLHLACEEHILQKIEVAQREMNSAQEAANNESKSTAGDKHDTARAMMHIQKEQNARLLADANQLQIGLAKINPQISLDSAVLGSLVQTNHETFYISVGLGKITVEGTVYYALSVQSPLSKAMAGLKSGNTFQVNGREYRIESIC